MEQELSSAAVAVAGVTAVGSLGTWTIVAQRLRQQGEVIPSEPRLGVPWNGWHVFFLFLAGNFLPVIAYPINGQKLGASLSDMSPEKLARLMATMGVLSLIALLLGLLVIKLVTHATLQDFGLSWRHVVRDSIVGSFGFMAATLPVLGIQFVVSQLVEYDHPVLDMLSGKTTEQLWIVATLSAVVVAPLMEEFLFRVLLQGWLERISLGSQLETIPLQKTSPDAHEDEGDFAVEADPLNPYVSPQTRPAKPVVVEPQAVPPRAIWPIWTSAMIFALMHYGQGAAPVPLLFLGAILGYVYRQTHRVVPCVVLHALFNLFSLLIFRLSVQS